MSTPSVTSAAGQRRHVAAIIWGSAAILALMALGVLAPVHRQRQAAAEEASRLDDELRRMRRSAPDMQARLAQAEAFHEHLEQEWEQLRARVDTFKGRSPLTQALSADEDARIDFKVALFDARVRLREKALQVGAEVPSDLGIAEEISDAEDTETRLWQLAAIVKLVKQSLDLGLPSINRIAPLPPFDHALLAQENAVVREFPVHVTLQCPFDKLTTFIRSLLREDGFFAMRRFVIERTAPENDEPLRVTMVCGAQLFRLRKAGDPVILPPASDGGTAAPTSAANGRERP